MAAIAIGGPAAAGPAAAIGHGLVLWLFWFWSLGLPLDHHDAQTPVSSST